MTFSELMVRILDKVTGFKALFTVAVMALLWVHDFNADNATVLSNLIYAVLGAKAVQYAALAYVDKGKTPEV